MIRMLIGSPIRQKSSILKQFLIGLDEVEKEGIKVEYFFVDDNTEEASSKLLSKFAITHDAIIKKGNELFSSLKDNNYVCDSYEHHWQSENIIRITEFKDSIIEFAIINKYDYLFLVDSDIVLDHRTINQLVSRNVEIVSNVFWSQWQINKSLIPQCFWIPDLYQQNKAFNVKLSPEEANKIRREMVEKLKKPGLYSVDGLGACTLIARSALEKGVRFKEVPNLSVPGEDRHFCIRAGVLGINLYMDTVYPVYHIYREEYLDRVDEFKRDGFKFDMCQTFTETVNSYPKKKSVYTRIKNKIIRMKNA